MKNTIYFLLLLLFLGSCKNASKDNNNDSAFLQDENLIDHPGKKLMETNCYVCHSPTATEADRIAPPMVAIKKHYISDDTSKEDFKTAIQEWIKNPSKDKAKMFGAVNRFGVMPKTPYPQETIDQIADYMFDNDIEEPEWFQKHFNQENRQGKGHGRGKEMGKGFHKGMGKAQLLEDKNTSYEALGLKYALSTKAELGKNLMGTIQKKGTLEALKFCNEKAYPLTDSMSIVNHAKIKRVSDLPRNQKNQANTKELQYIESFKTVIANNEEPKPIVEEMDDIVKFYYPITTNSMCLQCHGQPSTDIESKTLKSLAELYPNDKAIGYNVNQVRGIWSITFNKTNNE